MPWMKWLFGCCLLTQHLPEDAVARFSGTAPQTNPLFHLQPRELGFPLRYQPSGARMPSSASPKPPLCLCFWAAGLEAQTSRALVSPRTQQVPGWGSLGMFSRPFCCRTPAAMTPIPPFASLLSLQPLSPGNESQASLWVSLRACKFLGPIRTGKKKVNFLVLSSFLAFRNKPKAHSNPPFPATSLSTSSCIPRLTAGVGKAALWGHFGIS